MKLIITSLALAISAPLLHAQWTKATPNNTELRGVTNLNNASFYKLDIKQIQTQLLTASKVGAGQTVNIYVPTTSGKIERFAVNSFPVMDETLANKYNLGSYVGVGVDDPSKTIRFSVAPNDFQATIMGGDKYTFISPTSLDKTYYTVSEKSNKDVHPFSCGTKENPKSVARLQKLRDDAAVANKSNNKTFHTLRLAMSVTGEYTAYFGGVDKALAQVNATLTRVNAVFEQEFNLHVNMINAPALIFADASTDPYSPAGQFCRWNYELMTTLHGGQYGVTDADFDIGHLFGAEGGGGNAGCIGCIGSNDVSFTPVPASDPYGCGYDYNEPENYKGSGITSPADKKPFGDNFDIDYVAHEMGHQLGDSHTYSFYEQYLNAEMEPGSGSTIMGYAGITGSNTDVQKHSDPYFHAASIDQVQAVLTNTNVSVKTPITNNPPVITPMTTTYTIPKSTAFVLTAQATDPDGDALTYSWEQMDPSKIYGGVGKANGSNNYGNAIAIGNNTSGANFRSLPPSSSPTRYFPKLATVLAGNLKNVNDFEAVSTVSKTTNFRVTVRDNRPAGQAQTAFANQKIVVGSAAAFTVNMPTGNAGEPVNLTWVVSGTNVSPYNVTNVKIDYTTDNGTTWTTLLASTPNNGAASVTFPAELANKQVIVRISAIDNVFYAVNKFTLGSLATGEVNSTSVKLYPNPAVDVVHFSNAKSNIAYEIFNTAGQLVMKGETKDAQINVAKLVKGLYLVKVNINGESSTTKFEKN
ncbi:reprolysin-like metallopeptidase [Soonwooa sp.]|uniref:zinc-dependent metalloprotease n=1 Tax=Soonwooa sp. TaxID=1938592 RepID=UPI002635837A|nr:zinc-dependent metalloprotease family protein [Soonwooa sp.]